MEGSSLLCTELHPGDLFRNIEQPRSSKQDISSTVIHATCRPGAMPIASIRQIARWSVDSEVPPFQSVYAGIPEQSWDALLSRTLGRIYLGFANICWK